MKFNFYTDPGHGWIKVPKKLLIKLGIDNAITPFSYVRGEYAYLEEDTDASTFITAMKKANKTVELKAHNSNKSSRIRNYQSYTN